MDQAMEQNAQYSSDIQAQHPMNGARLLAMARDRSIAGRESLAGSVSLILAGRGEAFSAS
jgi:hypothetical protein